MVSFVAVLFLSLLCVSIATVHVRVEVEGRLVCKIDDLVKRPPAPPAAISLLRGDGYLNGVIGNSTAHAIEPYGGSFKVTGQYEYDDKVVVRRNTLSLRVVHYCPDAQRHLKIIRDLSKEAVKESGGGGGDNSFADYDLGDIVLNP